MQARLPLSFIGRYLDGATMLAEILFGLIMTLTFTLGAGLMIVEQGREGARQLLIALIGCNIAWGVIDGALYMVGEWFDRGRRQRLGVAIRQAPDEAAAEAIVATELDEFLADGTEAAERASLYRRIASTVRARPGSPVRVTRADVMGALASFVLVFSASLPAAIPFLLVERALVALRISNAILLALLFVTGYFFAKQTLGRPWIAGLSLLAGGALLVLTAIVLGG